MAADTECPLTARELELLGLLSQGITREAAAVRLEISVGTVNNHLRLIRAKLQVANTAQAIALALRRGCRECECNQEHA